MGVVGRLDQYASMLATEFDDYSMSENLLKYSNDFSQGVWAGFCGSKSNITYNTIDVVSPDGRNNSTKVARGSNGCDGSLSWGLLWNSSTGGIIIDTTNTFTASIYARGAVGGEVINVGFNDSQMTNHTLTTSWQRISRTGIANTTDRGFQVKSDNINQTFYIWKAQLEIGSVATDHTPTTTTAINRVLAATTNTNITGLSTYFSSGFSENVGAATTLAANVFPPYDLVYDDFGGTLFGPGQGRYMRQNTDKSVIVYNEIDEVSDFRDIVRSGLVLDIDMQQPLSYTGRGLTLYDLSGNNNNATAVTTLGVANDAPGTVISLDTSSEIRVDLTANVNKYAFTFSYWGRPTAVPDSNYQGICRLIDTSNPAHGYYFTMDTREVATPSVLHYVKDYATNNWDTRQMISNAEYLNYKWHYYTLVMFAENDWKSYLDGQLLGTNTTPSQDLSSYGNINRVYFGGSSCNFNIANFSMYSTSLTSTQILQNFNALKHRFGL